MCGTEELSIIGIRHSLKQRHKEIMHIAACENEGQEQWTQKGVRERTTTWRSGRHIVRAER